VAVAPQVRVRDAFGNPVGGASVTFAVTAGGGSVSPVTPVLTASDGTATATSWTLGPAAGVANNMLTATVAGGGVSGNPATFTASATPGAIASVELVAGDGQSATVGTAVAVAPQVLVTDAFGNPVQGASVTFQVVGGGGTVLPAAPVSTDVDGTATATSWTLGAAAGVNNNSVTATVAGAGITGNPVAFIASGLAGGPASVAVFAGDGQSAPVGTAVSTAPQVLVTDAFDNPVQGAAVTYSVSSGGGTVVPTTPILTDASGLAAAASWTLGPAVGASNNTLIATVQGSGIAGNPATLTASATSGVAASVQVSAGNNQSAGVSSSVAIAPAVLVTDPFGNPVEGASVTFAVTSGGGSVVPTTAVLTDASGLATVTSWTLGVTAGASNNTLTATVAGAGITGNPVAFVASASAGPAASAALVTGGAQVATAGTAVAVPPQVLVTDAFGNPVQGASVTFAVTAGGGTVSPTTAIVTSALGTATVTSWTLGTTAGPDNNTLTATVAGPGIANNPMTVTASAVADAPATISVVEGDAQSTTVNTTVTVAPKVLVADQYGNPVPALSVTFAVTAGGGSVAPTTPVSTAADGTAAVTSWTLGTTAGTGNNTLSATAAGAGIAGNPTTFTASAAAGTAVQLLVEAGDSQSALAGTAVLTPPAVKVVDAFGNGVSGISVTFSVTSGDGSATGLDQVTGGTGIAAVGSWTLGPSDGSNTLDATAAGVAGTITFTATGLVGSATAMQLEGGDGQTGTVGATLAVPYAVRVVDTNGNGVPDIPVGWSVTGGGGSIDATSNTDGSGVATAARVLGTTAGSQTATASVGGLAGSPVTFTATALAGTAASVAVDAGDNQSATVSTAVATPPRVIVRDQFGNAVAGASVTFAVTAGGGAVVPLTAVTTDASGLAAATSWTLGTSAGASNNTLGATVSGPGIGGNPVSFAASATAGAPASVALVTGDNQSATVGTSVATAPQVIVRDQYDNLVQGASVTFAVTGGGGSVVPTTAVSTAANGTASATSWTLGTAAGANNNTLTATVSGGGVTGNPVTFTASGLVGPAAILEIANGDGQNATVNTAVSTPPQARVTDQYGNPVAGHSVTFSVTGGGGAVVPTTAITTDASGLAAVTSWTLGQSAGTNNNTLNATAGGSVTTGNPTTFTASATAGAPASVQATTSTNQTATVNTAVSTAPQVLVRDQFNNPVPNASVTFAVTAGGGLVTGGSQTTNASGFATVTSWTLGTSAGTSNNTLTATVAALSPVVFTASATAGGPAKVTLDAGDNQSATVNNAVATSPRVLVQDAFDNPVQGASVTFAVTGGGGAVVPTTAISTSASGLAAVTSWTLGTSAGTSNNTLSATVTGINPVTFTASATAGAAASIAINAGEGLAATVNTAVATDPQVIVLDQFGNPVAGHSVTFQVLTGSGAVVPTTAVTTDAAGLATVTSWTLGTVAGTNNNTLRAQAAGAGITNNPVAFTASATAGAPKTVTLSAGNNQTATVNTTVTIAPRVMVVDTFTNPVPNASVTFAVTGGSGSVTGESQTTNGSGLATVGSWGLGTSAGTNNNTLSATVTGAGITGNPVTFTASATPGAAASIAQNAGINQTATIGTAVATDPQVVVRDAFSNVVPSVTVIFAVTSGGGSATGTSQVTNASGLATVTSWNLSNTTSMSATGTYPNTLSATVQGTAISTSFTGSARYSWATHVNPIWIASPSCTSCHAGTSGGTSGLSLGGSAAQNYAQLFNVTLTCDDPANDLDGASYRRVSNSTGTTGRDRSFLWRFMIANPTDQISTCGPHATKASAANTTIIEAWVRNGAPQN
jgi:adhesin/invasin